MAKTISSASASIVLTAAYNPLSVSATGTVTGGIAVYGGTSQGWSVTNAGTVRGVSAGVELQSVSIVVNSGRIFGNYGVNLVAGGAVINTGTIGNPLSDTITSVGIVVKDGGTVTNAGTIIGDTALQFIGSYATRVILVPAAVFQGKVVGGSGTNTLELSTGTAVTVGTLKCLGTDFTNFGTIIVDAGADWTLAGTYPIGSGVMVSDMGTLTNTGSIASIVTVFNGGSLENLGTAGYGVTILAGGVIINGGGGAISSVIGGAYFGVQAGGAPATVINDGSIGGGNFGIILDSGGTVVNAGMISGGSIDGVQIYGGPGVLTNAGTISGGYYGVILDRGGSVSNVGTINGGSFGLVLDSGGTASNAGVISGNNDGIEVYGGPGTLTNVGTISGGTYGVILNSGGTVSNAGMISGVAAVQFVGSYADKLILNPGAAFDGSVVGGSGSNTLELAAGISTLSNFGLQFTGFGTLTVDDGAEWTLDASDTLASSICVNDVGGLLFNETAGTTLAVLANIEGAGRIVQTGTATLLLGSADSLTGGVSISRGTLELAAGSGAGGNAITFIGDSALRIDGTVMPSGTLVGFKADDVIDLADVTCTGGGSSTLTSGNVLHVVENGSSYNLQLDPAENFAGEYFHLMPVSGSGTGITEDATPCFCPGTLIRTERGEVPIESLAIGDLVLTHAHGLLPIQWIGRRSYAGRFLAGKRHILPIRIKPGALSASVPRRDLVVSPRHALYLDGVLIPAGLLVNGVSVLQEDVREVHYLHIELTEHDVIWAEGAAAETFVDDCSRGLFHNFHEYNVRYPNAVSRPARYCAPRLEHGYQLEAIRRRVGDRAGLKWPAPLLGRLRGYLDVANYREVTGWAQDVDYPEVPVCLDVVVNGRVVAQTLAGDYRVDLYAAGLGSGQHSFAVRLPAALDGGELHVLEVRRSADESPLARSPHFLRPRCWSPSLAIR